MELTRDAFLVEEGLDQRCELLKELGDCHAALGHHDRAGQCYDEAARLAPHKPGPHVGRGVVAIQTGALDEADRAFGQAIRRDDRCSEAYAGLGMVAQQRQDFARAFDLYMKALDRDVNNLVALLGLFQAAVQMGTFSGVIHYLEIYLDRHPDDVSVQFCLATLYARDRRLPEACDILRRLLALEPGHAEAAALLKEVERKRQAVGVETP
jgi:tetratricopeptide (TPR) repeat protein